MAKTFTITEGLENLGALKTGGQGSVYKAKRMGEIITAIKLLPTPIHSESTDDKNYVYFRNEVEKLKKVNEHPIPHVVRILNAGITDSGSFPYIEMEFIEGPDLEELLKPPHETVFTISETIKVAEQVSRALAHCHKVGVKHGDIKSNNIKYNTHTGNYVLLDFGLAVMSDEQRRTSLRHAGAIEFMAPEQNNGDMLYETDIYSFGIILYELIAGRVPFPLTKSGETSRNNVMLAHMEVPVPDLLALRKQSLPANWSDAKKQHENAVPTWLLQIIYKCLEKSPGNRYKNGMELHDVISKYRVATIGTQSDELLEVLRKENEQLQRDKKFLQQQLVEQMSQPVIAEESFVTTQQNVTGNTRKGSMLASPVARLFSFILIAGIAVAALYFIFKKKDDSAINNSTLIIPSDSQRSETGKTVLKNQAFGRYKVVTDKAYFYKGANGSARTSAYLEPPDIITPTAEDNGFFYTEFTNWEKHVTKGWIRKTDVALIEGSESANDQLTDDEIASKLKAARKDLDKQEIGDALIIYKELAEQNVPEAMYQYGNLSLQGNNDAMSCDEAIGWIKKASDKGYTLAKRTLGFLYLFARNDEILKINNYDRCEYEKSFSKGTRLLTDAVIAGDTTAKRLLDEINARKNSEQE
jgi:serine/threonine protein kinase